MKLNKKDIALFLIGLIFFIAVNFQKYFHTPLYEYGDHAANAIQIIKAKNFNLIHGNYSRWAFFHPGPAFFYVYALGETVFYDILKIVPTPFNASLLSGLIIQYGFLFWSTYLLEKNTKGLFLNGTNLVFGLVFFSAFPYVFLDTWPPLVLVLPFLLFITSTVFTLSGKRNSLLPLLISSGFLIHGHVVNLLFVMPVLLLSIYSYIKKSSVNIESKNLKFEKSYSYILVLIFIALIFLLPLIMDLKTLEYSNANRILTFFLETNTSLQQPKDVFYYLLILPTLDSSLFEVPRNCGEVCRNFIVQKIPIYLLYIVLLLVSYRLYPRVKKIILNKNNKEFMKNSFQIILLMSLLSLIWIFRQNGLMYLFNSFFIYSLIFYILIILSLPIQIKINTFIEKQKYLNLILITVLFLTIFSFYKFKLIVSLGYMESEFIHTKFNTENVPSLNNKGIKVVLVKQQFWPEEISLFLKLKRLGYNPYYLPTVDFVFYPALEYIFNENKISGYKLSDTKDYTVYEIVEGQDGSFKLPNNKSIIVRTP